MATAKVQVVSQSDYLPARLKLLEKEKEAVRLRDELAKERQTLPIVEITKDYSFTDIDAGTGEKVTYSLSDLFFGRRTLIIYHAMFDPNWEACCPSCTVLMESLQALEHLNSRGVTVVAVSRAPIEKIKAYRERLGFRHPWVSSNGSDFNYDFAVTVDESKGQGTYNFRDKRENEEKGMPWFTRGEQPGNSCFVRGDTGTGIGETGKVYHTYSSYARGGEICIPTYAWLDMTLIGRQDGSTGESGLGFKRRDEYTADELMGVWKKK